jgi:hypothetical protein
MLLLRTQDKTKPEDTKQEVTATKQKNYSATIPKAYISGKMKETKQYQTKVTIIIVEP